jgi:predicted RNase H-like nuclease (RuvC/YqgF family)
MMASPTEPDLIEINAMLQALLSQSRNINNTMAQILKIFSELHDEVHLMVKTLDITREKRFEEEINSMEAQIKLLSSQLEEKKNTKADIRSTSDKLRKVTKEEIDEYNRKKQIDWHVVRQTMVNAAAGAIAVGIIWGIITKLPEAALWFRTFMGR